MTAKNNFSQPIRLNKPIFFYVYNLLKKNSSKEKNVCGIIVATFVDCVRTRLCDCVEQFNYYKVKQLRAKLSALVVCG